MKSLCNLLNFRFTIVETYCKLVRCLRAVLLLMLSSFAVSCFQRRGFVVSPFGKPSGSSSRNSSRTTSPDLKVLKKHEREFEKSTQADCIHLKSFISGGFLQLFHDRFGFWRSVPLMNSVLWVMHQHPTNLPFVTRRYSHSLYFEQGTAGWFRFDFFCLHLNAGLKD